LVVHVGLLEDVLFGFAFFKVTTRRDKCRRVVGHVGHKVPVAEEVRPESSLTGDYRRGLRIGQWGVDRVGG
jgi:hypothetical protein